MFRPLINLKWLLTGSGLRFQERPRTRQLLTLLPNLTTFNQQPFDHSVLNATPTDFSVSLSSIPMSAPSAPSMATT